MMEVALVTLVAINRPRLAEIILSLEGYETRLMNGSSPGAGRDILLEGRTCEGFELITLS